MADAPQWIINVGTVAGGALTAFAGWIVMRRETKKPEPTETGRIVAMTGALGDSRTVEALIDQLGHNERTMRDAERATISNTREIERSTEMMGDVRRALDARNMAAATEEARLLAAIDKSRAAQSSGRADNAG